MAINLVSQTTFTTGVLIGDTGVNGATPSPTAVGGVDVSAALEIQSTSGGLVLPRMTSAQRTAIATPVNGMEVYDSTLNDTVVYMNGAWAQQNPATGFLYASGTLTAAQINGMFAAGVPLIPAQGANKSIIVNSFTANLIFGTAAFANGGNIRLQFGTVVGGSTAITGTIPATFLTGAAANLLTTVTGSFLQVTTAIGVNTPVSISNITAAFTAGGTCTLNWSIWYSVIPAQ